MVFSIRNKRSTYKVNRVLLLIGILCCVVAPLQARWKNSLPEVFDDSDVTLMKKSAQDPLVGKPIGSVFHWTNPETKHSGSVTLLRLFDYADHSCQVVEHYIHIGEDEGFQYSSTYCKSSKGIWKVLP